VTIRRFLGAVLPVVVGIVVSTLLLLAAGANPWEALSALASGSVGSGAKLADTIMAWSPLVLASAGLVVTYRAGLWNIGVEGQVTAGAIAASGVARAVGGPGWMVMAAAVAAGFVGGAVWGLAAGLLRVKGRVNEIFGGLGLGFVAQALATYLVIGPWKRAGIASTSGTEPFREQVWMPVVGSTRLSLVAPLLAIAAVIVIWWLLARTRFGLELKAVGANLASARLVGIRSERVMLGAFGIGGGLAGVAGSVVVLGIQHKLVPAVSGGRGFLAILVVLLSGLAIRGVPAVALFFAAISVGVSQLNLQLDLDSSLGGVLQGVVVLAAILIGGWRALRTEVGES
jgi:simple sugar transport system permease protein